MFKQKHLYLKVLDIKISNCIKKHRQITKYNVIHLRNNIKTKQCLNILTQSQYKKLIKFIIEIFFTVIFTTNVY